MPLTEYIVPAFYAVQATTPEEARDAIFGMLESHEYDQEVDTVGHISTVCIGNIDEITCEEENDHE